MNQKLTKDILQRFSCFLVGGEKKNCGHKILLESLFILRKNNNFNISSKNENLENFSSQKITNDSIATRSVQEGFKNQAETISQFLCLPYFYFVKDSKNSFPHFNLLKTLRKTNDKFLICNEKKTVMASQPYQQFEKTLQKKAVVKKSQQELDNKLIRKESILSKSICVQSIENVKPILETRKIRKGRMTYKVPLVTSSQRQEGKAISLLIENANFRKKNELKRIGSLVSDADLTYNKTSNKEHLQNKNSFTLPLLYVWQTAMNQPTANTSYDKKLLILPSVYQSTDKESQKTVSYKRQNFSRSRILKEKSIGKNIFLMVPEKKHFLSSLRKPNIKYCLSEELFDSINGKGGSIEKKKQLHNLALQNRAYQHFRWW